MQRFDEEAGHLGLHVSWAKTKIRSVGHGAALPALSVGANTVDSVSEFISFGSKISSVGYSTPEVMRRIALCGIGHESAWPGLEAEKPEPCHQAPSL